MGVILTAYFDLLGHGDWKTTKISQMLLKNGDEYHRIESVKESPTKTNPRKYSIIVEGLDGFFGVNT